MFRVSRFPSYRQLDQMDCGPICLKIVGEHFGREYHLDHLRQISSISKGGVSLAGLSNALTEMGIQSVGVIASLNEVKEEMPLPAIAHWRGNHFVVIYRCGRKFLYLSDPAIGLLKLSYQEFMDGWCQAGSNQGILLLLEPNSSSTISTPSVESFAGFGFLVQYILPYTKYLYQLGLGLSIAAAIQIIFPLVTKSLVDVGIGYLDIKFIFLIAMFQLLLMLTLSGTYLIRDWILLHLNSRISLNMLSNFLDRILQMPLSFLDSKTTGDFMQRIYDHHKVEEFLGASAMSVLFDLSTVIVFGVVLYLFDIHVFMIFFSGTTIFFLWSFSFMKRREKVDHQIFDLQRKEQSNLLQILKAVIDIKINNSEIRRKTEWAKNQIHLFQLKTNLLKIDQLQINGGKVIHEFTKIIIIFYSAQAVISAEITLGTMLAIQFVVASLSLPVSSIIDFSINAQRARLSLVRLSEIHSLPQENCAGCIRKKKRAKGAIRIMNLSFGFNEEFLILKNLSAVIPEGKITAIVGPSGSGKTTLLKLLLKLYVPKEGKIIVGEEHLDDLNHQEWRKRCGVVLQEGIIFNDTLERNITEGKSSRPSDLVRLRRAIQLSNLSELVDQLPLGLQTKIGEVGQNLSGGEKQRVLIARAIYKEPNYFFLDEATSSLDSENEKVISQNLLQAFTKHAVVIVAHRLSTVRSADQILVMNKGSIVESGKHEELLLKKGIYYELVQNQL